MLTILKYLKVLLFIPLYFILNIPPSFAVSTFQNFSKKDPSYAVANIPDSLLTKANAVIRFYHKQFEVHNIGKATEKIKAVITILNNKTDYGDLQVYYDQFTKVGKIKAKLYDKTGNKIRDIHKSEIDDYAAFDGFSIYNDSRFKHIDFTYGIYPYTIEYEYKVEHNGLQSYASWYPQDYKTSVEKSIFDLQLPSSLTFRFKAFNLQNKPSISNKEGQRNHRWKLQNLVAITQESYVPDTYKSLPALLTLPNNFKVDGYEGNMENWKNFGLFMYQLNHNRDNLSPEMIQKVNALTANVTSNTEKIEILYNYLKENMRYVSVQLGIGGWQTYDAAYVEKNKYGDCKALTNFMKGMLKTIGIQSYYSLISAGRQRIEIDDSFTVPYFNHVILNVPSEDIWLECTSNSSPINYLGSNTENRPTLLITENGGILTKTPAITNNQQIGQTIITLEENGAASIECKTKLTGVLHETIRWITNNYSPEEQEKWFVKNQNFPSFEIENLDLKATTNTPKANCDYKIKVKRYASKAGKRLFVPINLVNQLSRSLPKDEDRQQPVAFKLSYEDVDEIIFKIPNNYKVESLPKEMEKLVTPYGSYFIQIEEKEGQIIYKRNLKIKPVQLPPNQYNDLRGFYKKVSKMDNAKIVLVRKTG